MNGRVARPAEQFLLLVSEDRERRRVGVQNAAGVIDGIDRVGHVHHQRRERLRSGRIKAGVGPGVTRDHGG